MVVTKILKDHYEDLLSFIDTLEVKEVGLDFQMFAKEMDIVFALPSSETKNTEEEPLNWEYAIAKHFFELGIKAHKFESSEQLLAEMRGEESVSKVWHTTMEEPNGEDSIVIVYDNGCTVEPSFKDFKSYSEWKTIKQSYRVKLWAYLDVLLSLSSVERNGKNLKELKTMLDDSLSKETEDSSSGCTTRMARKCLREMSWIAGAKENTVLMAL